MAIFAPLSIARQALLAHQTAVEVTGQNIANVNTPGYSRQRLVLEAVPPRGSLFGGGVQVRSVDQIVDPFLEARLLANASAFGATTTTRDLLQRVEASFPVTGGGIGDALDQFFAAANGLANDPESIPARQDLLDRAAALAQQLRSGAAGLQTLQRESDDRLTEQVRDANVTLETIASLNREIVAGEAAGRSTNELRDARQQALHSLAQTLPINVVEQGDGSVSVFAESGIGLTIGPNAARLATKLDGTLVGLDGAPLSRVGVVDSNGGFIALPGPFGGTVGALLTLRDQTLAGNAADLNLLATSLRDVVNAVQTDPTGLDLDGAVGTPLFAGSGAADLTVALTDPRGIAAARSANPGDNANALALAALAPTPVAALGGVTLSDFFGRFHASIGSQARAANDQASIEEQVGNTLAAQRDAISGVSLEEEFTDLIRFQRGFQAAAQLISVSNRMLDDLLGIVS
jgi:flagellar hook-associated protein 1